MVLIQYILELTIINKSKPGRSNNDRYEKLESRFFC